MSAGWDGDIFTEVEAVGAIVNGIWTDFHNPQPYPLSAETADFRDYDDRCALAHLGIFSIDKHKETRP